MFGIGLTRASKLAMIPLGGGAVCGMGGFRCRVKAKEDGFSSCSNICPPLTRPKERNTLEASFIVAIDAAIAAVFELICNAEIRPPIVQRIPAADVIPDALIAILKAENLAVHTHHAKTFLVHCGEIAHCIKRLGGFVPPCVPLPLHEPLVVGGVYKRNLALSERNCGVC